MADAELSERRVYVLPKELLDRLRAYQSKAGLGSEVETVRRLLDSALQMRDTLDDVLIKLKSRYADEKDLRILCRDVLITHSLVHEVKIGDGALSFLFAGDEHGQIDKMGQTFKGGTDTYPSWYPFPPTEKRANSRQKEPNIDDEIPF